MSRLLVAILGVALTLPVVRADDAKSKDAEKPKGKPASEVLDGALAKAKSEGKAVFLAFGSPSCGWCKYLDKYNTRPAVEKILGSHLLFAKVDIDENPGGEDLYKKFSPSPSGVPLWVILSADGKVLADSFAEVPGKKKDNVGFPYEPHEVAHYEKAIRFAIPKLTDAEVNALLTELKAAGPMKKKD